MKPSKSKYPCWEKVKLTLRSLWSEVVQSLGRELKEGHVEKQRDVAQAGQMNCLVSFNLSKVGVEHEKKHSQWKQK